MVGNSGVKVPTALVRADGEVLVPVINISGSPVELDATEALAILDELGGDSIPIIAHTPGESPCEVEAASEGAEEVYPIFCWICLKECGTFRHVGRDHFLWLICCENHAPVKQRSYRISSESHKIVETFTD
jgi:hypothetical protein